MVHRLQRSQQHHRQDGGQAATIDPEDEAAAALITRILLEHFGDGQPVHADVVMDTVQYRLAMEETAVAVHSGQDNGGAIDCDDDNDDDDGTAGGQHSYGDSGRRRDERYNYCVWADRRMSHVYHVCLMRLVRSGRVRVVYDCGGGCGGFREDNDPAGRHRCNGCDADRAETTSTIGSGVRRPRETPPPRIRRRTRRLHY